LNDHLLQHREHVQRKERGGMRGEKRRGILKKGEREGKRRK